MIDKISRRVETLSYWQQPILSAPLEGGITNRNFRVKHGDETFFVRVGEDIPVHGVYRFNELAASRAAHAAGLSPEVVHAEPGALVLRFIEGQTLNAAEVRNPKRLLTLVDLLKTCHHEMPKHLPGTALTFWVFQVIRGYAKTLREGESRMVPVLPRFLEINSALEHTVGAIELVFGHNDLLAGNFIDDGKRLWLIDWDYAGFNSPLFDLANLTSNNEFSEKQEHTLLEEYFESRTDKDLWRRYHAMKCASLLREAMWGMVSEIHSELDFDFVKYTAENLERFEKAHTHFVENIA